MTDEFRSHEAGKSEAGALVPGVGLHSVKAMPKEMKSGVRVRGIEFRSRETKRSEVSALAPDVRVHREKAMTKEMKSKARVHGFPASEFLPLKASIVVFPFLNSPFHAAHD